MRAFHQYMAQTFKYRLPHNHSMHKAVALLIACFSLLLGVVLMDVSYTGNVVREIDASLYQGTNLAVALSILVGILIAISLIYHQLNKPLYHELARQR